MRLDDASEYMDIDKWTRMEKLLDKYNVKPIYGIIPNNQDSDLLKYGKVKGFWDLMRGWSDKGWISALHGYTHVFETSEGGINPVNNKSEFAGVPYEKQCQKIEHGCAILREKGIVPTIFFAPAHTFDDNTVKALREKTDIRIISDTIADDVYYENEMYFIPQQSGRCRKLPFKTTTFCYHPNIMEDKDFDLLEEFLRQHHSEFGVMQESILKRRKFGILDWFYRKLYFIRRK